MAIDVSYRDTFSTSAKDLSRFQKNFIKTESVVEGTFAVTQSDTPAMSVKVAPGVAYFYGSGANSTTMYEFESDAEETVIIGASGVQARIDIICLKVDASTQVASIVAIAGTPSGSPAVPATPASHYKLAEVAVGISVTTITNANITDKRTPAQIFADNIITGWNALTTGNFTFASTSTINTSVDLTGSIQAGDKIKITTASNTDYFFVTAITSSLITVYGGTDYQVRNAVFTSVSLSREVSPFGFPRDKSKWRLTLSDNSTSAFRNNATLGEINTAFRLAVPAGNWIVRLYHHAGIANNTSIIGMYAQFGLSTSTSSFSDNRGIRILRTRDTTSTNQYRLAASGMIEFPVVSSSAFTLYIISQTIDTNTEVTPNFTVGATNPRPIIMEAEIAYL